jgi:putative SOS response-associated peptidase YedK
VFPLVVKVRLSKCWRQVETVNMCGRYAITSAPEAIRRLFGYDEQPNFPPRYNVAPTQPVPIVRHLEGQRRFALVRWGLIPSWVKDPKSFSLIINGRGESALDKPAFRNAMRRRRCLFPADGFYEWKRDGDRKTPFYIHQASGQPMAFAGLWEAWMGPNGEEMESATIVTTRANRALSGLHDRMPVIVAPDAFAFWLDPMVDADTAAALIAPAPDGVLAMHEVSSAVNRHANDGPGLIAPVTQRPDGAAADAEAAMPTTAAPKRKARKDDGQASLF